MALPDLPIKVPKGTQTSDENLDTEYSEKSQTHKGTGREAIVPKGRLQVSEDSGLYYGDEE